MSGGSLEYLCFKVQDAVHTIAHYERGGPRWAAFAEHLNLVADALHDCEWVMSSDYGYDGANESIDKVITADQAGVAALEIARRLHASLGDLLLQYDGSAAISEEERTDG